MSARHAFIPQRPQSCVNATQSPEPHLNITAPIPLGTSAGIGPGRNFDHPRASLDADPRDTPRNGGGKPRSLAALLGRKKGTMSPVAQPGGPGQAGGQGQSHKRSFNTIRRPDMTPLSIIPYPVPQPNAHTSGNQQVQTPRKTIGQGAYVFPRPSTPVSAPGVLKKGLEGYDDSRDNEGNADGIVFMGPGAEAESHVDTGGSVTGYMRVFSRSGSGGTGTNTGVMGQQGLGLKIVAPTPGYAHAGLGMHMDVQGDDEGAVDKLYAHQSRSLEDIPEEVSQGEVERITEPQRSLRRVKRGMGREEEMEVEAGPIGCGHQSQGPAKRMRHMQDENEEYTRLSSPQIPPTPAFPTASLRDLTDPSLTLDSLFENIAEFVNVEEFEAECKRWTTCTREEWLKGADGELTTFLGYDAD
ncbi:hypothetical protein BS17DRAFT_787034 [Gyrodon lividus]|nr:hypothetical protein BS17DRAFT_787034 [Gyrodon lividus]